MSIIVEKEGGVSCTAPTVCLNEFDVNRATWHGTRLGEFFTRAQLASRD